MENEAKELASCPECGCTDVETTAWVHINTWTLVDCEGPSSYDFCPQCDLAERPAEFKYCKYTNVAKPFDPEDVGEEA